MDNIQKVIQMPKADIAVSDHGQSRTMSNYFWGDLDFASRSKAEIALVRAALLEAGLGVGDEKKFGRERGDDWLVIRSLEPHTELIAPQVAKPAVRSERPQPQRVSSVPAGTMRMLSVRQPWAELIVSGVKDVENRSMVTHHRGPLLIHASLSKNDPEFFTDYDVHLDVPRGAIVGVVNVVDCSSELRSEWHEDGSYGWYLEDAKRFEKPIPYKGAVGIMKVALEVVEEALKQAKSDRASSTKSSKKAAVKQTAQAATKTSAIGKDRLFR